MTHHANAEPEDRWRSGRRTSDGTAVFRPGEELRCPGTFTQQGRRHLCGKSLREYVKPGSRVIVRVRSTTHPILPHGGTDTTCHGCRAQLEKFTILEATA